MADKKFTISGPGAADFITAQGGLDRPGTDPAKGTSELNDEGIVNQESVEPALDAPDPAVTRERGVTPPGRDEPRSE